MSGVWYGRCWFSSGVLREGRSASANLTGPHTSVGTPRIEPIGSHTQFPPHAHAVCDGAFPCGLPLSFTSLCAIAGPSALDHACAPTARAARAAFAHGRIRATRTCSDHFLMAGCRRAGSMVGRSSALDVRFLPPWTTGTRRRRATKDTGDLQLSDPPGDGQLSRRTESNFSARETRT